MIVARIAAQIGVSIVDRTVAQIGVSIVARIVGRNGVTNGAGTDGHGVPTVGTIGGTIAIITAISIGSVAIMRPIADIGIGGSTSASISVRRSLDRATG